MALSWRMSISKTTSRQGDQSPRGSRAEANALAKAIAALSPLPAAVEIWSIFVGVGVGAGVGIIAGIYPASRAALLDPIAAMRHEN